MKKDDFKSVPAEGAVERDWTNETLVLDMENTLGETFHFEIKPNEKDNLTTRASDMPDSKNKSKVVVNMTLPIL